MSNSVVSTNDNEKTTESNRSKRPRSSLACIRCRKKKVKCDFLQPTCSRCSASGLQCSYATPPRRVDGQAFDQLGNNVEQMKRRMRQMQSEIAMLKNNLQPTVYNPSLANSYNLLNDFGPNAIANANSGPMDQHVTWKLSLSPSGVRIDTNIASVADLYRILLNGISQLNINRDSHGHLSNADSANDGSFGPRSIRAIESGHKDTSTTRQLWEVDHHAIPKPIKIESPPSFLHDTTLPEGTINQLIHTYYHSCFLAYQIVDKDEFALQCKSTSKSDLLLVNSINAWMSKHSYIYHFCDNSKDRTTIGEAYFNKARQLLRARFDKSSSTTIHALLNMYMYQLNCERSTLAYLYIGLAIRMAQDLKLHKKRYMVDDPIQREKNKRLWWSAYWLDLCAALESNRPTMVDDKDCNIDYPSKMDHEDMETGVRIDFTVSSIKLMKIRKEITRHLPSEQAGQKLLSAIGRLELTLMDWLKNLPEAIRYDIDEDSGDPIFRKKGNFCDEACLILNIQYHTSWIMLHKGFLPRPGQTAAPVALLSQNICTKGANFITQLLQIYVQELDLCHFFYTLEGIVTSVNIHKANACSPESDVAQNAKQNLIITRNILQNSPLAYMDKVNDVIESIQQTLNDNDFQPSIVPISSPVSSKGKSSGRSKLQASSKKATSTAHQNVIPIHQPIYLQQYNNTFYSSGSESPSVSVSYLEGDIPSPPDVHKDMMLYAQQHQRHQQQNQHQHNQQQHNHQQHTQHHHNQHHHNQHHHNPQQPNHYYDHHSSSNNSVTTEPQHHNHSLPESTLRDNQQECNSFGNGIILNDPTSSLMDLNLRNNNSVTSNGRESISQFLYRDMNFEIGGSEHFNVDTQSVSTAINDNGTNFISHSNAFVDTCGVNIQSPQQPQHQSQPTNFLRNNHHMDSPNVYLYNPDMTPQTSYHGYIGKKRNDREWEEYP